MQAIINIQDPVMGSWHQLIVEQASNLTAENPHTVYLDGTALPADFETYQAIARFLAAFNTDFAGITDGLDTYLADIWDKRELEARSQP